MPFVELSDVRCYFEMIGSGDPLLLIPGLGRTCRMWDNVAGPLADSFTLIMPDNRGMGRSQPKRAARVMGDLAVDLVELLDALQLDRAHVLGISLGGVIAQWLAVQHPSRVDRLVLISTAHEFGPYLREMARLIGHALRYFPRDVFERTVEILGSSPGYIDANPAAVTEKIQTVREQKTPRRAVARQLLCLAQSDVHESAYQIAAPTLVIAGEQDALIPSCYGRRIARAIAHSEFRQIPDCGHNPITEAPDVVVEMIREFLTRCEARLAASKRRKELQSVT
ncbi:alpha/beta fold hydrolase [Fontivita pretiosa]|uniref:alpha/beta fold hydrolase n=1 Tax=Fontivita pretiosa TaxID=2989684 RepID=UPI003D177136